MKEKLFDSWNVQKKVVHDRLLGKGFIINTKEIRYVSLGCNVGYEQDGKKNFLRPVLVVRRIGSLYFCIPLTTKGKAGSIFYYGLRSVDFGKPSFLILSQGRVLDKRRFCYKINKVSATECNGIKKTSQRYVSMKSFLVTLKLLGESSAILQTFVLQL